MVNLPNAIPEELFGSAERVQAAIQYGQYPQQNPGRSLCCVHENTEGCAHVRSLGLKSPSEATS